jgi:hypothetical protein
LNRYENISVVMLPGASPTVLPRRSAPGGGGAALLQPKHPRPQELSSISVELHTDSSKLSPENLEKVRDILGFGLDGEVEFPPESVDRFVINGPPLVAEHS